MAGAVITSALVFKRAGRELMLKVRFFASLREGVGCDCIELRPEQAATVAEAIAALAERGPRWRELLLATNVLAAVNHEMVKPDHPLADGDELALFPPVTGG